MPVPVKHAYLGSVVGSWPIIQKASVDPLAHPMSLNARATILGTRPEPADGFNISTKSFFLKIDDVLVPFGTPREVTISFPLTSNYTLQQVIDRVNTLVGEDIAFNENGFLRLQSPRSGHASYLKLVTDSNPEVFAELGLFSETEAFGGELTKASHENPDREVALPGQLSAVHGEGYLSRVMNRLAFQLSANSDRTAGLLDRKRVAKRTILDRVFSGESGFTLDDMVYTGPAFWSNPPTQAQLENSIAILDLNNNEVVIETRSIVGGNTATYATDVDSGKLLVTVPESTAMSFVNMDASNDIYVMCSDVEFPALIRGIPLKVLEVVSNHSAYLMNVDPATGTRVTINISGVDVVKIEVLTDPVKVRALYSDSDMGQDVFRHKETVFSGTISHTELNNRIVVPSGDFTTSVAVGDLVTWSGHLEDYPHTNNGVYRVSKVIDDVTLELLSGPQDPTDVRSQAEDYGPVYLNPIGTMGNVTITTDGDFWPNPYVKLTHELTGSYRVVYLGMSDFRSASSDPAFIAGLTPFQEADDFVQKVLLRIIGPSINSIYNYLYDDRRLSLEDLNYRINKEHDYDGGRHTTIRPDRINMFPGVTGETVSVRAATSETTIAKVGVRNVSDVLKAEIDADGQILSTKGVAVGTAARVSDLYTERDSTTEAYPSLAFRDRRTNGVGLDTQEGRYFLSQVRTDRLVLHQANVAGSGTPRVAQMFKGNTTYKNLYTQMHQLPWEASTYDLGSSAAATDDVYGISIGGRWRNLFMSGYVEIVTHGADPSGVHCHWWPTDTNTYDLGTSPLRWRNMYLAGNARCNSLTVADSTLGYTIGGIVDHCSLESTMSGAGAELRFLRTYEYREVGGDAHAGTSHYLHHGFYASPTTTYESFLKLGGTWDTLQVGVAYLGIGTGAKGAASSVIVGQSAAGRYGAFPVTSDVWDLGSNSHRWYDIHGYNLYGKAVLPGDGFSALGSSGNYWPNAYLTNLQSNVVLPVSGASTLGGASPGQAWGNVYAYVLNPPSAGGGDIGTVALYWSRVWAQDGMFKGLPAVLPPVSGYSLNRNANNAIVANASVVNALGGTVAALVSGAQGSWNVENPVTRTGGGLAAGDWLVGLHDPAAPNASVLVSITESSNVHIVGIPQTIMYDGRLVMNAVRVITTGSPGVGVDTAFSIAVIGKPDIIP